MCISYLCVQARCMQRKEMSLVYPPEEKLVSGVSVVLPELLFNINDKDKLADKDKKLAEKNSCMHQKVLDALQKFESARNSEREADRKADIACKLARRVGIRIGGALGGNLKPLAVSNYGRLYLPF